LVRLGRSVFLAPGEKAAHDVGHSRGRIRGLTPGHQFVIFLDRFVFVRPKIVLSFADLDVPSLGLLAEEGLWQSHGGYSYQQ
jgi:hypothetical protein